MGDTTPEKALNQSANVAQPGQGGWRSGGTIQPSFVISTIPTAQNPNNVVRRTETQLNEEFLQKSPQELLALGAKLKSAGYRPGPINGRPTRQLRSAYINAITDLDAEISIGQQLDLDTYLVREGSSDTATSGPNASISKTVFTKDQAAYLVDAVYKNLTGEKAPDNDKKRLINDLIKRQQTMPSVTTYGKTGGVQTSVTTPGVNAEQFLVEEISQTNPAKASKALQGYEILMNKLGGLR